VPRVLSYPKMNLPNGTIIHRRTDVSALNDHWGVVVHIGPKMCVIHRQFLPVAKIESYTTYMNGHSLNGHMPSALSGKTTEQILQRVENTPVGEFDIIGNNCEQYVWRLTGMPGHSPHTTSRIIIVTLAALAFLYILSK
jgi:hypothetical protein